MTGTPRLTDSQATYFTAVDHVDHEACVAHAPDDDTYIIGVARFIRYGSAPDDAELLAVTVADSWQGRGLGAALLRVLTARAIEVGVRRFRAEMMADNAAIIGLLRSAGMTDETVSGRLATGHSSWPLATDSGAREPVGHDGPHVGVDAHADVGRRHLDVLGVGRAVVEAGRPTT